MNAVQMTKPRYITINDIPVLWEGQGAFDRGERPPDGRVPYHPPASKRDIRRDIYNAVYYSDGWVSLREISQLVGRKKSTRLRTHVEQLVAEGHLIRMAVHYRPGMPKYLYEVAR